MILLLTAAHKDFFKHYFSTTTGCVPNVPHLTKIKRGLDGRHLKPFLHQLSKYTMRGKRETKRLLKKGGFAVPAAGNGGGLSLPPQNENLNFLRPPHHPAIPTAIITVPTLPPGPTTAGWFFIKVEGPGGPLFFGFDRRGSVAEKGSGRRAIGDWAFVNFKPETQIYFSLPHAGPVDGGLFSPPGQEVRREVRGEFSAGKRTILRNGRYASGRPAEGGILVHRSGISSFRTTKRMLRFG